ncbi:MAG TPA: glycosyltransferase, partial [Candidatus Edwardsbacteria bacterium]|nr:glycosyltransferase [Candidatus Edwardsbacteria bacterium]
MTRILALTAIEAPFRSTLIATQLLRPLRGAQRHDPGLRIDCLALVPWTFYFSLRRPWRGLAESRERLAALRRELGRHGIALHVWPIAFPLLPRQFNLGSAQRLLFSACAIPVVALFIITHRGYDLIISRSYPATVLARTMRRRSGIPYVFDLRGMYPEECVNAGAFGPASPDYRAWKRIERGLIGGATRCVVVSEPFAEHVAAIAPDARIDVIPCCVDPSRYSYDPARKAPSKEAYGLQGRFVLLHLGSFGTPGDRGLVGKYLLRFKRAEPGAVLVVASGTPAFGPAIERALRAEGLRPGDYRILHPQPQEIVDILALGDAGLVLERQVANTKVCLSVKLGEYLASGLPVICTPFVEGAARLIEQYRCGLVVDPDADEPVEKEKIFLETLPRLRENGFRLVNEMLSLDQCSERWSR